MATKTMTTQQLIDLINDNYDAYDCFGVRAHNAVCAVGDVLPVSGDYQSDSREWGERVGDLPGTCVIGFSASGSDTKVGAAVEAAIKRAQQYRRDGCPIVLVASKSAAHPDVERQDDGEEILINPVVLAVLP